MSKYSAYLPIFPILSVSETSQNLPPFSVLNHLLESSSICLSIHTQQIFLHFQNCLLHLSESSSIYPSISPYSAYPLTLPTFKVSVTPQNLHQFVSSFQQTQHIFLHFQNSMSQKPLRIFLYMSLFFHILNTYSYTFSIQSLDHLSKLDRELRVWCWNRTLRADIVVLHCLTLFKSNVYPPLCRCPWRRAPRRKCVGCCVWPCPVWGGSWRWHPWWSSGSSRMKCCNTSRLSPPCCPP